MRIAQIAPLFESVPPRAYGGTERVMHWLTEALVAMGHVRSKAIVAMRQSEVDRVLARARLGWPKIQTLREG